MGRPSTYSPALAATICDRLSQGETLVRICEDSDMPSRATVYAWMDERSEFQTRCARAREAQAEFMDHRILGVADRVESGDLDPQAAKVVLSALQWRAAKLNPRRYGERLEVDSRLAVSHYLVEVPVVAQTVDAWLTQNAKSSGVPSLAHKPHS